MYQLRMYQSKELSLLWAGYVKTETHIVFFPTGGGKPFVLER